MKYIPRVVDSSLKEALDRASAVLVRGPKWCGKTSTCQQVAKSALMMRDPDSYASNLEAAQIKPSILLRGQKPRLIDEWQVAPILWDAVINEVDKNEGQCGQFLLTGSATPVNLRDKLSPKHTGTGRIVRINMDPMTLFETGVSSSEISIEGLFSDKEITAMDASGASDVTVENYAELICSGGWPAPIANNQKNASVASDYVDAICESDMTEASDTTLDPERAHALLRSIGRNSAQEASNKTLLADVQEVGVGMSEPTLRVYLNALRRLFVLEEVRAWAPTLRSKTPLRSASVLHFCDPSIAAAALQTAPDGLLSDMETFGFLFESLCVRDLRVYMRRLGGDVFHYRDKNGLEVDVILRLKNGAWAGVEVKLGGQKNIDIAAEHLLKLANKVDANRTGSPKFLMVLTGGQYAYSRPDGVLVVPLGCLAP